MSDNCLFCKISRGDIPSRKVYEDDELYAFHDIHPIAPVHFLVVPKRHITSLQDVSQEDAGVLGRMTVLLTQLALEQGCRPGPDGGFRVMVNNGADGGQEVPHLHYHVIGGPRPWKRD